MAPCTRKTCYAKACVKSETTPRSCGRTASARKAKVGQTNSDLRLTSSQYRHPSPTDFEQPKTILRMRIRQGPCGSHVSLVTRPFNTSDRKGPVSDAGKRKPVLGLCNDRASWVRRLRSKPHRRAELAELARSCVSDTQTDMKL
ncbi:hypothetical protein N7450_011548 [Penicillium hetheringtonii]|uniref:Uncharacterized protein n=1 Tax=Penicillium hetheringtonii TaxID=911720 RepID=A0AAD6GN29_9EURO|nr:hypothetical protein N7450_011548 [Penicillium hetheringtonii]